MANLKADSLRACGTALRTYNFVKRRGVYLQTGDTQAVTGWLGLNLTTRGLPAVLQVNPVVGVRHVHLEEALVELAGWSPPIACPSRPLGYLMPSKRFVQWDFSASDDLSAVAEDLADAVSEFGQPFIDRWSNWETFAAHIDGSGLLLENERQIVLPLILAFAGDRLRAEQIVRDELIKVGDSEDIYSRSYRQFTSKFVGREFNLSPT